MSSAKWRPFCLSHNVLTHWGFNEISDILQKLSKAFYWQKVVIFSPNDKSWRLLQGIVWHQICHKPFPESVASAEQTCTTRVSVCQWILLYLSILFHIIALKWLGTCGKASFSIYAPARSPIMRKHHRWCNFSHQLWIILLMDWLKYWLVDWLIDWLVDWLVDWLDLTSLTLEGHTWQSTTQLTNNWRKRQDQYDLPLRHKSLSQMQS